MFLPKTRRRIKKIKKRSGQWGVLNLYRKKMQNIQLFFPKKTGLKNIFGKNYHNTLLNWRIFHRVVQIF